MFVVVIKGLFAKSFRGLAIYPFIFLQDKKLRENPKIINHERIHLRQQIEMLWFFFFLWYGIEFLIRWVQHGNTNTAYHQISFEKEAYANDTNPEYLQNRNCWNFIRYL
ncbi:MAG: hypothetical protein WCY25_09955 [Moheibacter sp.]